MTENDINKLVLANKNDLEEKRKVTKEEINYSKVSFIYNIYYYFLIEIKRNKKQILLSMIKEKLEMDVVRNKKLNYNIN